MFRSALLSLLVPVTAQATVTFEFSGVGDIAVDGVVQPGADYVWTIDFDESTAVDGDVGDDDGDFNDVTIEGMTVEVNGTLYTIDTGVTDANIDVTSNPNSGGNSMELLLITWVGGSPTMDGRARFYTDIGGLDGTFFSDINDLGSAQVHAGGNDNASTHDSSITFSSSRPLVTTSGVTLVMDADYLEGTEDLTLGLQGGVLAPTAVCGDDVCEAGDEDALGCPSDCAERCDGVDQDHNGLVDEGDVCRCYGQTIATSDYLACL